MLGGGEGREGGKVGWWVRGGSVGGWMVDWVDDWVDWVMVD
jgi:hypothetical protein